MANKWTLDLLHDELKALTARVERVRLAISALEVLDARPTTTPAAPRAKPVRKKVRRKVRRVPVKRRGFTVKMRRAPNPIVDDAPAADASDAAARREVLLTFIRKSEVGLTGGELRTRTPKMDEKARQNALSVLKLKGHIKRAGNTWVAA